MKEIIKQIQIIKNNIVLMERKNQLKLRLGCISKLLINFLNKFKIYNENEKFTSKIT